MPSFTHSPVCEALGVEIKGLDLTQRLSDADQQELQSLFDKHHLLIFRNQNIEAEDQIHLMGSFGPVCDETGTGKCYSFVSNAREDGLFGEFALVFHSDWSWRSYQPPVFSLYGLEVDGASVPTEFASTTRAYRKLPPTLRERIAGRTVVNADNLNKEISEGYGRRVQLLSYPTLPPEATHPRAFHPVPRPHPRTGMPVLFVSERHTSHFEGLTHEENEAVIAQCFEVLYAPDNTYTHCWNKGDLVVWDNIALQHGRKGPERGIEQKRRTLRRVVVSEKSVKELLTGVGFRKTPGGLTSNNNELARN